MRAPLSFFLEAQTLREYFAMKENDRSYFERNENEAITERKKGTMRHAVLGSECAFVPVKAKVWSDSVTYTRAISNL